MNLKMSDFLFEEKDVQDLDKSNQADSEESESSSGEDKQNKRNKPKSELSDQQLKKGPEISWTEMNNIIAPNIAKVFFESSSNLKKNAQLKNQTKDKKEKELSSKEKIALKKASKVEDLPLGMLDRPLLNKLFQRNYAVGLQGKIGRIHINPFQTKTGADQIEGASPFDFEFAKQKQIFFGMLSNENSEIIRCLGKAVIVAFPAAGAKITEKNLPLCSLLYTNYSKDNPVLYSFPKVAFFLLPFNKFSDFQKSTFATVKACLSQEKTPAKNESFVYQKGISSLLLEGPQDALTGAAHDDDALHNDGVPNPVEDFAKFSEELSEESGKLKSILERLNELDKLNPEEMSSRLAELRVLQSQIADIAERFTDICEKKSEEIENVYVQNPALANRWIDLIKAEVEKFEEIFGHVDRVFESIKNKNQKDQDQSQESNQESGEESSQESNQESGEESNQESGEESSQESAGESNKESAGDEEGEGDEEGDVDEEGDEESDEDSDEDEEGASKTDLSRVRSESNFIVDFICESYLESIDEDTPRVRNKDYTKKAIEAYKADYVKKNNLKVMGVTGTVGVAYSTAAALGYSVAALSGFGLLPALAGGFLYNIFAEDHVKKKADKEGAKYAMLMTDESNGLPKESIQGIFNKLKIDIKVDREKKNLVKVISEIVEESKRLTERSQLMSLRFLLNEEDEQKKEKSNSNQKKKLQKISKDFVVRIIEEENLKLYDLIDQNERLTKKFLSKLSGLLRRNFDIQITDIVPESVVESARDQALSVIDRSAKKRQPASPAIDYAARVDNNPVAKAVNEVNHSGNSDLVASMLAAMIADPKGFGQLFNSLKSEDKSGLQVILDFAKIDQSKVDVNELQGNVPEKIAVNKTALERALEMLDVCKKHEYVFVKNTNKNTVEIIDLLNQTDYKKVLEEKYKLTERDSDLPGVVQFLSNVIFKNLDKEDKDYAYKSFSIGQVYLKCKNRSINPRDNLKTSAEAFYFINDQSRSSNFLDDKRKLKVKNYKVEDNKFTLNIQDEDDVSSMSSEELSNLMRGVSVNDSKVIVMQGRELIKEWRELWNI